jgi:hypothetical protein
LLSEGDDRIRETRLAVKTTFAVEHDLSGSHRIASGATAARPAATDGRLYINTQTGKIEYAAGGVWFTTPPAVYQSISGAGTGVLYTYAGTVPATVTVAIETSWTSGGVSITTQPLIVPLPGIGGPGRLVVSLTPITRLEIRAISTYVQMTGTVMIV